MPCPLPSGNQATESLLARARCYGFLGQKKTAMFDFTSVLRTEPGNAQALCGRALLHLALDKQKVPAPRPLLGTGQVVVLRRGTALLLRPAGERTQSQASSVTHASKPRLLWGSRSLTITSMVSGSLSLSSEESLCSQHPSVWIDMQGLGLTGGPHLRVKTPWLPLGCHPQLSIQDLWFRVVGLQGQGWEVVHCQAQGRYFPQRSCVQRQPQPNSPGQGHFAAKSDVMGEKLKPTVCSDASLGQSTPRGNQPARFLNSLRTGVPEDKEK